MKAIKLLMTVTVIGLIWVSSSLAGDDEIASPFGEDLSLWDEDFDFGDDFEWAGFSGSAPLEEGPGDVGSDDDESDESSDESPDVIPVDDWIIDENFYSDFEGSEGEELGWGETDDHPGMPGPEENALWIVFPYSNNVRTTKLVIQKYRYAKELIIPGTNGAITIYEEGPDGIVKTYVPGWYVKARRAYRIWFSADSVGDHTVWYEVHNEKSNVTNKSNEITYRVFENLAVIVPNEAKCENETAILRALASGCDNPSYQWYKGRTSDTGTRIENATSSTYIIRDVQQIDEGYYTCKVTCNGNSTEDAGWLNVGFWECDEKGCECNLSRVTVP